MSGGTASGARPLRVVHIVVRVLLALALVVLLVLIGIKQAPRVIALVGASTPTTAVAAGSQTPGVVATTETPPSASPTISVPTVTIPTHASGGGGGGTTASKPPAQTKPVISSLSADDVMCPYLASDAPGATTPPSPQVTIHWRSTGGEQAWFGVATSDAQAAPYSEVHQSDSITLDWPCPSATQLYTVTVVGPGGKTSRSITVHNTGRQG